MSDATKLFGQVTRDIAAVPEGHLVGVDEQGRVVDRGPIPGGADDTWGGPCLTGFHDQCVGSRPAFHDSTERIYCGCPHHEARA